MPPENARRGFSRALPGMKECILLRQNVLTFSVPRSRSRTGHIPWSKTPLMLYWRCHIRRYVWVFTIQEHLFLCFVQKLTLKQGSDLHFYRGHLKCPTNFICGHEFVGTVVEKGGDVKNLEIGDRVVVPFYTSCQECYYCVRGQASRCLRGELFGNSAPANTIDGGQAEYVRVPLADTTCVKTPNG